MKKIITASLIALCICAGAYVAHAQSPRILLDGTVREAPVGSAQDIRILLDAGGVSINAFTLAIHVPDELEVEAIRDGSSIVGVWLEKEFDDRNNVIRLEGIMPGGFAGTTIPNSMIVQPGLLAVLQIRAKQEGVWHITASQGRAYVHNGSGSEVGISDVSYELITSGSGENSTDAQDVTDTAAPEPFQIFIARTDGEFGGKYVASFSAKDRDSGIKRYEARQTIRTAIIPIPAPWREAASPMTLAYQWLPSIIEIKAIDFSGNERTEAMQHPQRDLRWYEYVDILIVLLVVVAAGGILRKKVL